MPESLGRAYRNGDWDALGGSYFSELSEGAHIVEPLRRAAALGGATEPSTTAGYVRLRLVCGGRGRAELDVPGVLGGGAHSPGGGGGDAGADASGERIEATFAPPDMWSRQKDSGRTMAELFAASGVPLTRADNNRVQGHMMVKELLREAAGRAAGAPLLLELPRDGERPQGYPGGRSQPERLRPRAARGHSPRGRGQVLLHKPRPRRRGGAGGQRARRRTRRGYLTTSSF